MKYDEFYLLINSRTGLSFASSDNKGQAEKEGYVDFEVTSTSEPKVFLIRLFFGKRIFNATFLGTSEECLKKEHDLFSLFREKGLFVVGDYNFIRLPLIEVVKNMDIKEKFIGLSDWKETITEDYFVAAARVSSRDLLKDADGISSKVFVISYLSTKLEKRYAYDKFDKKYQGDSFDIISSLRKALQNAEYRTF